MSMSNKQINRICKNCKLYDANNEECSVIVLYEGQKIKVPMSPQDNCLYETEFFDPTTNSMQNFSEDVKQIKAWMENENGEKVGEKKWWQFWRIKEKTVVKIESSDCFLPED